MCSTLCQVYSNQSKRMNDGLWIVSLKKRNVLIEKWNRSEIQNTTLKNTTLPQMRPDHDNPDHNLRDL